MLSHVAPGRPCHDGRATRSEPDPRRWRGRQVVERGLIGGACPNIACLPSKNVIRSANVAHFARHAAEYGIQLKSMTVDMEGVRARKRAMVDAQIAFHRQKFAMPNETFLLAEG